MMELERDGECGLQQAVPVSAPGQKGIVEDIAVLIDDAVEFSGHQRGGSNNHHVVAKGARTCLAGQSCQVHVLGIELFQIVGIGDVA